MLLSLEDFEDAARRVLPRPIFGYASGASETGISMRANRAAWERYAFLPRMLVDTSARTQRTTLFGREYDAPFGIAPMGGTAMAAFEGDLVLARAAAQANIPMMMSGAALTPLEQVRREGPTAWFQAYLPGDDEVIARLVERVGRAGYDTLVVTTDVQVQSNREHYIRTGFHTPLRPTLRLAWDSALRPRWLFGMLVRTLLVHGMPHFENMGPRLPLISRTGTRDPGGRERLAWRHIEAIRRRWGGRLVLKGILDVADARRARELGVDGIVVSNHGGRQLDGAIASLDALPEVVEAVGDQAEVYLDGGVRRGVDVVMALALGAKAVLLGRPAMYVLAFGGARGVEQVLEILREEVENALALLGCRSPSEVTRNHISAAPSA
jgi:L-lactate dehydrogenase (cytochrome)